MAFGGAGGDHLKTGCHGVYTACKDVKIIWDKIEDRRKWGICQGEAAAIFITKPSIIQTEYSFTLRLPSLVPV